VDKVGAHAHALIDVSDGLASELYYLSDASRAALLIDPARIPVHPELPRYLADRKETPWRFAIESGEEYQLLAAVPMAAVDRMPVTVIGSVLEARDDQPHGVWLRGEQGVLEELLRRGYDHLSSYESRG
jgi:thiamine-monophosphate kinase